MNSTNQRERDIIDRYEDLSRASSRMLEAARIERWDQVRCGQSHCEGLIAQLKELGDLRPRDPGLRERKAQLVRAVLAADAEIRNLAQPRLAHLETLMRVPHNTRRLAESYGRVERGR
jgi:flagellar protein FliT